MMSRSVYQVLSWKQAVLKGRHSVQGAVAMLIGCLLLVTGCAVQPSVKAPLAKAPSLSTQAEAAYYFLSYQDYLLKGQTSKALEALNKALERDPSPELYLELALQYWRQEAFGQVETVLESALQAFPDHRRLALTLSRFFTEQGQNEQALKVLMSYVANHPQDLVGLRHLSRFYLQMREYDQAQAVLTTIPEAEWTADEHYLMAQVASAQHNRRLTIKHLKQAIQLKPDFIKALAELGYQYELSKNYVAAEKIYSRLLKLDHENQEIFIRLIELNLKLNNPERGLLLVQQAPAVDRFLLRAFSLFLQNDFSAYAARLYDLFSGQLADLPEGKLYHALTIYKTEQDIDEALRILQSIDSSQDIYAQVLSLQARLFWQRGDIQKALSSARSGRQSFPDEERFWLLESDILQDAGQKKQALQVLMQARQHFPDSVPVLFQTGLMAYEQGKHKKAISLMEKILELKPDHAEAMNFIGYSLVEKGVKLERAFELISRALKMDPNNGYFLDSLAWYQYQSGHFEKAWQIILSAVAAIDNDPVIWEHYAEIALALGKTEKAAEGYRKALETGSTNREKLEQKLLDL